MNKFIALLCLFTMSLMLNAQAQELGVFQQIETETLDGEDFIFPDNLRAPSLNIVLLAISEEQDNGTWQGEALVDWYAALDAKGSLSEEVMAWHFSFMKVPFFVKGFIRRGMAKDYEGKIPLDQAAHDVEDADEREERDRKGGHPHHQGHHFANQSTKQTDNN